MPKFLSYFLDALNLTIARSDEKGYQSEKRKYTNNWPRQLIFSQPYYVDEENKHQLVTVSSIGEPPKEEFNDGYFVRKAKCMLKDGKAGLIEGSLCGIFLGGGIGMYKNADKSNEQQKNDGSNADNDESTLNNNFAFVTACNGAIILGVICTVLSSIRGAIYCN